MRIKIGDNKMIIYNHIETISGDYSDVTPFAVDVIKLLKRAHVKEPSKKYQGLTTGKFPWWIPTQTGREFKKYRITFARKENVRDKTAIFLYAENEMEAKVMAERFLKSCDSATQTGYQLYSRPKVVDESN